MQKLANTKALKFAILPHLKKLGSEYKLVFIILPFLLASFYLATQVFVVGGAALLTFYLVSSLKDNRLFIGSGVFISSLLFLSVPALSYTWITNPASLQGVLPSSSISSSQVAQVETENQDLEAKVKASQTVKEDLDLNDDQSQVDIEKVKQANLNTANNDPRTTLYKVEQVVDGDTLILENFGVVDLLGVDAPNLVTNGSPEECFALASKKNLEQLTADKMVYLDFQNDFARMDKNYRTLAYVYIETGYYLNLELIKGGFAELSEYEFNLENKKPLWETEMFARQNKKGLWDETNCQNTEPNKQKITAKVTPKTNKTNPPQTQPNQPSTQPTNPEATPTNPNDPTVVTNWTSANGDVSNDPNSQPVLPIPDFDVYDTITHDRNHDGRITCADFDGPVSDPDLLNRFPTLRRDKNGIACSPTPVI